MNPWEEIDKIEPDVQNPSETISELFKGISIFTEGKVDFKLHRVNFFPEEVTYADPFDGLGELLSSTETQHPEYGYNPQSSKHKQFFRYRIILYPTSSVDVEYELFKIRYPILLYPVKFFLDKTDFKELESKFTINDELIAESQPKLIDIVTKIIKSKSTIRLIKRLMAI